MNQQPPDSNNRDEPPVRSIYRPRRVLTVALAATIPLVSLAYSSLTASNRSHVVVDAISSPEGYTDESSCIECHQEASAFHLTGHANTLRPGSSDLSIRRLGELRSEFGDSDSSRIAFLDQMPYATTSNEDVERNVELSWCFGSGAHAHTWVSTLEDSSGVTDLLEYRWTWFQSLDGFGVTPGQSTDAPAGEIVSLGLQFDGPKAERCFSCHATTVPMQQGCIIEDEVRLGVTCQRCHGPMQQHVASGGDLNDAMWKPSDAIGQLESVKRCGVCHRMPDEREEHEIRPDNIDIVRFQPMGLLQSRCYVNSEMTCTTCHDPHRPLAQQDSQGIWQCVQCHDSNNKSHVLCGAGMADDCLTCHMPQIEMESPVSFTDHWIRIREQKTDRSSAGNPND